MWEYFMHYAKGKYYYTHFIDKTGLVSLSIFLLFFFFFFL